MLVHLRECSKFCEIQNEGSSLTDVARKLAHCGGPSRSFLGGMTARWVFSKPSPNSERSRPLGLRDPSPPRCPSRDVPLVRDRRICSSYSAGAPKCSRESRSSGMVFAYQIYCAVARAGGGTRKAAITGAYVALAIAPGKLIRGKTTSSVR
jgi:hypothetical protein